MAEAVQRPTTRFVQQTALDLQALHRVRSRLVSERTAVINRIRGFLLERGIIVRQGLRFLRQALPDILAKRTDVCHHAWYASLLILPVTGGNSMNELNP